MRSKTGFVAVFLQKVSYTIQRQSGLYLKYKLLRNEKRH